jgi:hypothetical protein
VRSASNPITGSSGHVDGARRRRRQLEHVGVEEQQIEARHLPVEIETEVADADGQLAPRRERMSPLDIKEIRHN